MTAKKLIIFGAGDIAQLAYSYFTNDSPYQVEAFTIDREYITDTSLCKLPVVEFENVEKQYSPDQYDMFIALSYSKLNALRREKYEVAKASGYKLASYISSRATVLNDSNIGDNCFILEDNTVQPFVTIGNNVTLWSGNHIGHHSTIEDNVFIASHVVISGNVKVEDSCFIGVNATMRDGITIGQQCVIGAGALILSDCEEKGVYLGKATERSRVPSNRLRNI